MAADQPIISNTETPASDSHEMALVLHSGLSLLDNGSQLVDDDFEPMDEDLAIVVGQQSMDVECFDAPNDEFNPVPLMIVRPDSVETNEKKRPAITKVYTRRRAAPAGFKSSKCNTVQKPALFDSSNGNRKHSKHDKDDDFEPLGLSRKRGRPVGSKPAKRRTEQKPLSIDSSSSEDDKDKDADFEPEVYNDDGENNYARVEGTARDKAVEKLLAKVPSFVKRMKKSHVVRGFWLGLPAMFCREHLPENDVNIVLEDEEGHIWETNYLAAKTGLSGGWQGFAKDQDLKVDDDVVFHLVESRFKVYILRENDFTTSDEVLPSLDTSKEKKTSKKKEESSKSKEEPEVVTRARREEAAEGGIIPTGIDTGDFVAVKRLVNFKIILGDGSVVGPRVLSDSQRRTYYKLCYDRKALLHRHLPKQINPMLGAGLIAETANIAEGIRASSAASIKDLAVWKKTLKSMELMGMDVAFMRNRVEDILGILSAPSWTSGREEPEGHASKEVRSLESRISTLKAVVKEMDAKMKEMVEASAQDREQAVRRLASSPW